MAEEYDPEKFYIHSTDRRGHVIQFRVALPPDQFRRAEELIATHKYGWRTVQDLCRDAIIHRIHWAAEQEPLAREMYDIFVAEAEVGQMLAVRDANDKLVSGYRELANGLRGKERLKLAITIQEKIDDAARLHLSERSILHLRELVEHLKFDGGL